MHQSEKVPKVPLSAVPRFEQSDIDGSCDTSNDTPRDDDTPSKHSGALSFRQKLRAIEVSGRLQEASETVLLDRTAQVLREKQERDQKEQEAVEKQQQQEQEIQQQIADAVKASNEANQRMMQREQRKMQADVSALEAQIEEMQLELKTERAATTAKAADSQSELLLCMEKSQSLGQHLEMVMLTSQQCVALCGLNLLLTKWRMLPVTRAIAIARERFALWKFGKQMRSMLKK